MTSHQNRTKPGAAHLIIDNRAQATEAYQAGVAALVPAVLARFEGVPTVSELRAMGGFSSIVREEVAILAATMTQSVGSALIPTTVGEVFSSYLNIKTNDIANQVRRVWLDAQR